jgi:peptidoglycan/LPS O-acetylase OafA/YrhL
MQSSTIELRRGVSAVDIFTCCSILLITHLVLRHSSTRKDNLDVNAAHCAVIITHLYRRVIQIVLDRSED